MKKLKEEWKQVPGYERYLVSNTGRVISTIKNRTKELKGQEDAVGYIHYRLYASDDRNGYYPNNRGKRPILFKIHRLVLDTFLPNADTTLEVNHINGDKHDNVITNLEWVTRKENIQHSWDLGIRASTHKKVARANRKPLVAVHRDGHERYFQGNVVARAAFNCSLAAIAISLKEERELQKGPAKGYTFIRLKELPDHCYFEEVDNLEEKIDMYNDKYWGKKRKNKRVV